MANKYSVNWRIKGLKGLQLKPGASIVLTEDEALPFLKSGALSLDSASAVPQAGTEGAGSTDTPGSTEGKPVDLSTMTKAQLVEYAKAQLDLGLDINKTKNELLAAIADAAGK